MARFHFNVHGDEEIADTEGVVLPNLAAAKRRAIKEARSLLSADVLEGALMIDRHFLITNELGEIVLIVLFAEALTLPGGSST